jgi:hypothetical protein
MQAARFFDSLEALTLLADAPNLKKVLAMAKNKTRCVK